MRLWGEAGRIGTDGGGAGVRAVVAEPQGLRDARCSVLGTEAEERMELCQSLG